MDIVDTYERFSSSQIQNYEYNQSNINFIDIIDEHYIAEKTILFWSKLNLQSIQRNEKKIIIPSKISILMQFFQVYQEACF